MAGKRKNGTGTVRKRTNGGWEARFIVSYSLEGISGSARMYFRYLFPMLQITPKEHIAGSASGCILSGTGT